MKKFFLLALSLISLNAFSQDEIYLQNAVMTPSTASELWVSVNLPSYDNAMLAVTVDLEFPTGFTVGTTIQNYGDGCKWDYDFGEPGSATNFAGSCEKKTDDGTYYHVTVYSNKTTTPFHGSNGNLFSLKVKAPAEAGVYPVKVRKSTYAAKSSVDAENLTWTSAQTSYIVVGTPSDATLALEGIIPSAVNTALATETAISTLDLTKVTASNGTFTYVPGRDVVAPTADVTSDVKIAVPAPSGYASICLPYDVTANCYTYTGITGSTANFTSATNLTANTAAIIDAAVDVTLTAQKLAGVAQKEITSGYYLKGGKILSVSTNAYIPALRGSWAGSAPVKGFTIDGETVGINGIGADEAETIYNTAGVRMNKAQRGVNIINGKKVVVK